MPEDSTITAVQSMRLASSMAGAMSSKGRAMMARSALAEARSAKVPLVARMSMKR
jgi:hypothetical protein